MKKHNQEGSEGKKTIKKQKVRVRNQGIKNMKIIRTPPEIKELLAKNKDRYKWVSKSGKVILVHRLMWEENYGKIPEGMVVHHINENKKDNRLCNLKLITHKEHRRIHKRFSVNRLELI